MATCVALAAIPRMVLLPIAWVKWRSEDGRVGLVWADKVFRLYCHKRSCAIQWLKTRRGGSYYNRFAAVVSTTTTNRKGYFSEVRKSADAPYGVTTACKLLGGFGGVCPLVPPYSNAPMSQFPVCGRLTLSWAMSRDGMPSAVKLPPVW